MEEKVHPQYLKGFNQAYFLAQHKPQLIKKLLKTATENDYFQGMKDGVHTYEQEKTQKQSRLQELNNLQSKRDPDQDLEV